MRNIVRDLHYRGLSDTMKLFLAGLMIVIGLTTGAMGASLDSHGVSPEKIFKCQSTNISANFTGAVGAVKVYVNISGIMVNGTIQSENNNYSMIYSGGTWVYYYGNDPAMLWGNKSISFKADTNPSVNNTQDHIFVYSDECTGTDIQSYRNTSFRGAFGNYTRQLFAGSQNMLEFAQQPFLNKIGSVIYVLIMFLICVVIYIKNQSVMQPIIIVFITAASLMGSNLIPDQYRIYALLLTAVATAAIFWRLGKSA
jgi:hypothetical protein